MSPSQPAPVLAPVLTSDVHDGPGHRGRRHGGRAAQVGPAAGALAALEVPVGGRDAPPAGGDHVPVAGHAHRAARAPPLEAGLPEDPVQPGLLGGGLDGHRAGDHQGPDPGATPPAPDHPGRFQVGVAAVGAGADEGVVDGGAGQGGSPGERPM